MDRVTPATRHLAWDGCVNVRDLGGLPTSDGRVTRRGTLVRADSLDGLTDAGWEALWAYGIRTVVDLRNAEERLAVEDRRPTRLTTLHVPLEDLDDRDFWQTYGHLDTTPLIFQPILTHWPARVVSVLATIAQASPGGVVFHCARGRDRTGLVAVLLLTFAGVPHQAIVDDYSQSASLLVQFDRLREEDRIAARLAAANTTASAVLVAMLASLDVDTFLRTAGLCERELDALRARLLEATRSSG